MIELIPRRAVARAAVAAIAVGCATPAFAIPYDHNRVHRGDFVYVPADGGCVGNPAACDLARY